METQTDLSFLSLLLLQCGDVESNPGPPRKAPAATKAEPKKELSESDKIGRMEQQVINFKSFIR
jgi:hypothetical protein